MKKYNEKDLAKTNRAGLVELLNAEGISFDEKETNAMLRMKLAEVEIPEEPESGALEEEKEISESADEGVQAPDEKPGSDEVPEEESKESSAEEEKASSETHANRVVTSEIARRRGKFFAGSKPADSAVVAEINRRKNASSASKHVSVAAAVAARKKAPKL